MVNLAMQLSVIENIGRELPNLLDRVNDEIGLALENETPETWDSLSSELDRAIEQLCWIRMNVKQGVILMENSGE